MPTDGTAPSFEFPETMTPQPLMITTEVGGNVVAQVSLARQMLTPAIRQTVILENGLIGNLYQPVGKESLPGVLVLGGSDGGLPPYLIEEAALLARHGFVTLALAYFGLGSLPPTLTEIPLEYFGKAIAWLQRQPGVRADRIGVVGHSRGGELALLLGATYQQLKAVVSYVGSGPVFPSLPDATTSAWSYHGKPFPYVPNAVDSDPGIFPKAVIPVERTAGPILLIAAADDQLWPSPLLSEIAFDRLRQFHHPYPDELHVYPNAGHLIAWPYRPTAGTLICGGTVAGMAAAAAAAWPRVLHTLGTLRT